MLLSIKCSFISVGWRTLERLVVLRDHFTATFKDSIEVVCARGGRRVSLRFVLVAPTEQFSSLFFAVVGLVDG